MILIRRLAAALAPVNVVCVIFFLTRPADSQSPAVETAPQGAAVFAQHCLGCHDGNDARAPGLGAMRGRAPQAIVDALTAGSMRYQGLVLSGDERRAVAEFITGRTLRGTVSGATLGRCAARPALGDLATSPLWNGWGPTIVNTHAQPAAQAGVTAEQVPQLELKWAFGFPDTTSAWSQPAIVLGRLFVGSQNGTVYSLNAKTGCIIWTFTAHGGVRASVSIGARSGTGRSAAYSAYFADQNGYAYAVDAADGTLLWSRRVDDHPLVRLTGAPALHDGRLYVPTSSYEEGGKPPGYACCTFRGSLVALDARTGEEVWKAYTIPDRPTLIREYAGGTQIWAPSGGAIWSAPTIDVKRGAIYVGVGNTYSGRAQPTTDAIVAFDLKTGAIRWARQMTPGERDVFGCTPGELDCGAKAGPDFDFGASPVLVRAPSGRDLIIAAQKSGVAYALDPDHKGQQVWRYRAGGGSGLGGIQWGFAADATQAYFPVADIYSEMPGGLHAVTLATGKRVWFTPPPPPVCGRPGRACSGAQFSAVTVIPGIVFSPSNDGAVRAYSTKDGAIVWTYDANHDFTTLNGVRAKGGSMNGPAPVVAGGMVYVSSGYGAFGLRPGNVLLAFGVP
ncbi:MAG: PQQ-binding-like beta-propeller repeat protein [Acidobacteria bacterium]|nr:PQQ-binding-like beta-propeller repeat protein [Acidobacteriota bacterium]